VRRARVERHELHLGDLRGHALADLATPVPDHPGAQVVAGVQQLAALVVEEVGPLTARDQAGVVARVPGLEVTEVREEVPDAALRLLSGGSGVPGRLWHRVGGAETH
jgi:hypothetical protein